MNIFPLTEYVYLKKKPQENKPQRNPDITWGALHLQLQSFANSVLKHEFSLNAIRNSLLFPLV